MTTRKSFMSSEKRTGERDAQREAVGALFDGTGELVEPALAARRTTAQHLPIERIRPNPFQARHDFRDLAELADAIRVQGFTSRLRVRPAPHDVGYFELVYGERRLRAARLAALATIPCDIVDHSDAEMIEIGLAENIQRRDLDPLEEAQAFRTFIDQRGYSIRGLAERIGKAKGYIEGRLALLRVPVDVQDMVATRPDSIDAAQQIAKLPTPEARRPLIAAVTEGAISAQQVRVAVRDQTRNREASAPSAGKGATRAQIAQEVEVIGRIVARWQQVAMQDASVRTIVVAGAEQARAKIALLIEALPPETP